MARGASHQKRSEKRSEKRAQWRARLRRFERSTLSVVEFCRREQVSAPAFYQWRRKLSEAANAPSRRSPSPASPSHANFVPVQLAPAIGLEVRLEVRFPNGAQLTLPASDSELIRLSIQAIAQARTEPGEA